VYKLQAQAGHEHATAVLLRRRADVTAVDDSGRTPVDVAQSRWVQTALRQAWTDAKRQRLDPEAPAPPPAAAADDDEPSAGQPSSWAPPARVVRPAKLLRPFERSRSLDQPERSDAAASTRVSPSRNLRWPRLAVKVRAHCPCS